MTQDTGLRDVEAAFDVVHADLLKGLASVCADLGGDVHSLWSNAQISAVPNRDFPEATYSQTIHILAKAAEHFDCPDFGLRLAAKQQGTDLYGPLGMLMRHSATLGEALTSAITHMHVHSRAARLTRHRLPSGTGYVFAHELLIDHFEHQAQAMELVIFAGHLGAIALTKGKARARKILFRHHPISSLPVYHSYFGCEVLFEQPYDGMILSEADLACPVVHADPHAHAQMLTWVQQRFEGADVTPLTMQVKGAILRGLYAGQCSNAQVAAQLGLHTRTLHRKLLESGTHFQAIKDQVRQEALLYYICQTRYPFTWIADKLLFAEPAVMTRYCVKNLGMSPRRLREAKSVEAWALSENVKCDAGNIR